ncbi:MAG: hypothetical protein MUF18_18165 [Fimbriiglobus sp.]|jgi:hypothetical protein|nr:hypothetical protein [Fimbriiglobus sp.]
MSAPRVNLNLIDVPNPCTVPWDEMTGDDRVRFCGQCKKSVYHLSHMTREEAERLVGEVEGEMCVQFYRRADGTVVTHDCAVLRAAKKAGGTVFFLACCLLAVIDAILFGQVTLWLEGGKKQTFSQVGGGLAPIRSSR